MHVLTVEVGPDTDVSLVGTVLCQTVTRSPTSRVIAFRKGQTIEPTDLPILRSIESQSVRVLALEAGDVHEDDAGLRIAQAVKGPGLALQGPIQSRYNLVAAHRGVVVVNTTALREVNLVPDVSVFTVLPYQPVSAGDVVAGAKIIPIVTRETAMREVESIARNNPNLIDVLPFLPRPVGVVSKQRPDPRSRQRFEAILRRKLAWFGAELVALRYTEPDLASVTRGFRDVLTAGADVIITAGSSSADPLDSLIVAVQELGGRIEARGAPAHPGSFFWLGYIGSQPVFGLPSCGAYSEATVVDILLPRVMAGENINRVDIADLGAGGLFERGMSGRFPAYGIEEDGGGPDGGLI